MNFCQVTGGQTESDAYEPTVHTHRWAQNCDSHINDRGVDNVSRNNTVNAL